MKIQLIVSGGCNGCDKAEKMLQDIGTEFEMIDVTNNPEILNIYEIFTAPTIIINDKIAFSGVPKKEELIQKINESQ